MKCEEARTKMMAVLDGEPVDQAALDAHLARCADCREAWERLAAAERLLRGIPRLQAPAGFVGRTLARIDRKRRIRRAMLGGLALAAVAASGLALGVGTVVWDLSDLVKTLSPLLRAGLALAPRLADLAHTLIRSLYLTADALAAWFLLLAGCGLIATIGANWVWWLVVRRLQPTTVP